MSKTVILASDGISLSDTKTLEETVSSHSTSISNNATAIALKANSSDVYTKTETDGLISTEVSNRNSAIEQSASQIQLSVSETYSTKVETKMTNEAEGNIIQVDDAMAAPAIEFDVYGASTQVTTTGKNLLDTSNLVDGKYIGSTGNTGNEAGMCYTDDYSPITAGTYVISLTRGSTTKNTRLHGYDSSKNWVGQVWWNAVSGGTGRFTDVVSVPEGVSYLRLSFANTVTNIQLELGSTATEYEPYTGGKPSPNPDYPQPILSVDAPVMHANNTRGAIWWNQGVQVSSRTVTSKGVTYTAQDGKVTLSGTATGSETFQLYGNYQYTFVTGHKYLIKGGSSAKKVTVGGHSATWIFQLENGYTSAINVSVAADFTGTYEFYPQLFDLTLMFGAGNEPSTVAEFEAMFPEPYYSYNSGSWLDFGNWPVSDLLSESTDLRSLPNGTKDELHLNYLRPSTREGWAWYSREVVKRCDTMTLDGSQSGVKSNNRFYFRNNSVMRLTNYASSLLCDKLIAYAKHQSIGGGSLDNFVEGVSAWADSGNYPNQNWIYIALVDAFGMSTSELYQYLAENPITVQYPLATPVTETLSEIELPILHSSMCTVYTTADVTPGLYMKYWTLSAEGIVEPLLVSDSNSEAQLSAISSRVSTAESNITQNADNIATKVSKDGVISSINQSAETIKIQASKVEIDGTAIFNNSDFQTQLNNQSYATTTQVATAKQEAIDSIEVGGRNLVYNSNLSTISGYSNSPTISYLTYISVANYLANLEDGDPIVISFDAKADSNITAAEIYAYQESGHSIANDGTSHWKIDLTTEWQHYVIHTTVKDWTGTYNAGSIMFLYKSSNNTKRYLRKLKIESGTVATDWTPAPEDVDASISAVDSSLESYKSTTNTTLTSLQNQVDGQIEAWYKSVDPTESNEPASTWTTDALKARHMGDLYYNVINGHSWRWMQSGNTYEWQQIPDSDAAAALAVAQDAQTTANSKRRIFTTTPTVPYDVGDLWVDGSSVKYCSNMKTDSGTYSESDWAVTATDDSLAQTALNAAEVVQDNLNAVRTWYATCETAAGTAVKVATITPETTAFELRVGVIVNVEFTATNSAAVKNLKLNVNSTGEKSIKYMYNNGRSDLPAVGYLVAGIVYQFMYDGDYWTIQNMHYNTNSTYNLGQNLYYNTVKAKSVIAAETIIVGDANGYAQAQAGVAFDLSYPILWCTKAIAVNGTNYANLYTSVQDRNLKTNYSSFQGTAGAMVYLVGTVSGNTFTLNSGMLTSTEPTTEDGKIYIPIGRHGNQYVYASAPAYFFFDCQTTTLFAYLDGEFRQVTPTEIVSTHRIYYRTATANSSLAAPTTWIEEATGNVYNQWTTKVPPLAASTASGQTKYLYLYTCEQRKRLDGTTVCTKVLLDENTTVIDGGSIITNSITANQIAAGTITAAEIEAGTITATQIASSAITTDKLDASAVTADKIAANAITTAKLDAGAVTAAKINSGAITTDKLDAGAVTAAKIASGAITTDKLDAGAVTATKIDATDLHVRAVNIDGTIGFGQLSGVQASGNYALSSDIPQDISDLTNDVGFITSDDVPTTVAELTDSSNYALNSAIPTTVAQLTDSSNYALTSSIPTTVAQLTDSSNYALASNLTTEINQRKAQYGTCSTAAGTTPKAVTCANFELVAGNEITVKFSTANTSSGKIQLNVNSTGNKDVWVGNAVTSATNMLLWGANAYITFKYDGTQFQVIGEPRTWYGECNVAEATAAKTSTITGCVICKGTKVELAMTYANSAASPTLNISSTGAKNLYFGTGTTRPTISGGTSWLAANTATFTFDGATWRTQGKTYIDANSITTGYISADRIQGGSLSIGMFNNSTQADILNSNITVPTHVTDLQDGNNYSTTTQMNTAIGAAEQSAKTYADGKDSAIAAAARRTDVAIAVTAIDYDAGTATLQATLYIDGVVTTNNVTYQWLKDGSLISGATSRTLSVTAAMGLGHIYSCTIDYT